MLIKLPPPLPLFIMTSIYVGWEGVSLKKKKRKARMIHSQLLGVSLKKRKARMINSQLLGVSKNT